MPGPDASDGPVMGPTALTFQAYKIGDRTFVDRFDPRSTSPRENVRVRPVYDPDAPSSRRIAEALRDKAARKALLAYGRKLTGSVDGAKELVAEALKRLSGPDDAPWMHEEKPFVLHVMNVMHQSWDLSMRKHGAESEVTDSRLAHDETLPSPLIESSKRAIEGSMPADRRFQDQVSSYARPESVTSFSDPDTLARRRGWWIESNHEASIAVLEAVLTDLGSLDGEGPGPHEGPIRTIRSGHRRLPHRSPTRRPPDIEGSLRRPW
jgi:hypothetical protein